MGDIIKLIFALTIISVIAGLVIGVANDKTEGRIKELQLQAKQEAIEAVLPVGSKVNEMKDKGQGEVPSLYWTAFENDTLTAYAFEMSGSGYAGDIKFMVGVGIDGKILGLSVIDHNETPGLGSRVSETVSKKYVWYPISKEERAKPWFTEQFKGLSSLKPIGIDKNAGEWHKLDDNAKKELKGKNSVTAITGSTITTVAFTRSIERKAGEYIKALGGYCCPETKIKKDMEQDKVVEDNNNDNNGGTDD